MLTSNAQQCSTIWLTWAKFSITSWVAELSTGILPLYVLLYEVRKIWFSRPFLSGFINTIQLVYCALHVMSSQVPLRDDYYWLNGYPVWCTARVGMQMPFLWSSVCSFSSTTLSKLVSVDFRLCGSLLSWLSDLQRTQRNAGNQHFRKEGWREAGWAMYVISHG